MIRIHSVYRLTDVPLERVVLVVMLVGFTDGLFSAFAWHIESIEYIFALMLAQCSLAGILAIALGVAGRWPTIVRFAFPLVTVIASLFVAGAIDGGFNTGDARAVLIALLGGATLTSMGVAWLQQQMQLPQSRRMKFSIATLVTWTTIAAIMMGCGRLFGHSWRWRWELFARLEVLVAVTIGVLIGLSTMVWLHAFATSETYIRLRRLALGYVVTVLGMCGYSFVCNLFVWKWLSNGVEFIEPGTLVRLSSMYALVVVAVLAGLLVEYQPQSTQPQAASDAASDAVLDDATAAATNEGHGHESS